MSPCRRTQRGGEGVAGEQGRDHPRVERAEDVGHHVMVAELGEHVRHEEDGEHHVDVVGGVSADTNGLDKSVERAWRVTCPGPKRRDAAERTAEHGI